MAEEQRPPRRRRPDPAKAAAATLGQWSTEELERREREERLDTPIADTRINQRTINTLEDAGIMTVRELVSLSLEQVLGLDNFGARTLREVRRALLQLEISVLHWDPPQPSPSRKKRRK